MTKKNNILGLLILSTCIFSGNGFAQKARLKYADKLYQNNGYYFASEAYEDVIERHIDSSEVASKIADSYDKIGNTKKALDWYRFIQRKSSINQHQLERLALLERQVGNTERSNELLHKYEEQFGKSDITSTVLTNTTTADELNAKNMFALNTQTINSENSEFGVIYLSENKVLLVSSKRTKKAVQQIHSWTGNSFYSIYSASIDENGNILKKKVRVTGKINRKYNNGPLAFCEKTNTIYFTSNGALEKNSNKTTTAHLRIYKGNLVKNKKVKNITELAINVPNFSTAHPSVSKDGKQLFFASNRPGGEGGMDIYSVALNDDGQTIGEVVNLGEVINTSENDIFPFYNSKEEVLFFSSRGHFGLGGLDVFASRLNSEKQPISVENLGAPINSSSDDFSFINNMEQTKGYFASNRPGGKGSDDIYAFTQKQIIQKQSIVEGTIKDVFADTLLNNATILVTNQEGVILDSVKTDSKGYFKIPLNTSIQSDFTLVSSKDNFTKETLKVPFDKEQLVYKNDILLTPIISYSIVGSVVDKSTNQPINGVKVSILDSKENKPLSDALLSSPDGKFQSTNLPYSYQQEISYTIQLEKEGFEPTRTAIVRKLDKDNVISVQTAMTKIVKVKPEAKVVAPTETKVAVENKVVPVKVNETDLGQLMQIAPIYFDLNSSYLTVQGKSELDKVVNFLMENPNSAIEIRAHSDSRDEVKYNLWLSDKRAKSAMRYIMSKGISENRISGKGFGESELIVPDSEIEKATSDEEKEILHAKNRRTEFIIIKK